MALETLPKLRILDVSKNQIGTPLKELGQFIDKLKKLQGRQRKREREKERKREREREREKERQRDKKNKSITRKLIQNSEYKKIQ